MAIPWLTIGLVLAGELVFACGVAAITRLFSKHLEGQTYGLVVLGVAGVITIAGALIGWINVVILLGAFAVAALPMGFEYYSRMVRQARKVRQASEELLHEHARTDRQE
jgi:hypothetical protein